MDTAWHWVFLICAVAGATSIVFQFVMSLFGLAGHGFADGADLAHDLPHDLVHDGPHDVGHSLAHEVSHDQHGGHGPSWLFNLVSLRSIIAFLAFFGIGGMTALSANVSTMPSLLVALTFGITAFAVVGLLMLGMQQLKGDGTVQIERAIGEPATVYLPIPAAGAGMGKVHMRLQGRLSEYAARTAGALPLQVGAKVTVTRVCDFRTLEVEAMPEPAEALATSAAN
jgi:hypothetical protein